MKANPTKKFINEPSNCVREALLGLVRTRPDLCLLGQSDTVVLRNLDQKVHLVCGGGSGHEPAHCHYVEKGVLSASVCGGVFASPSTQQIIEAILHLKSKKGVLLIVKNYTGDVINFGAAASYCQGLGIEIKTLVVADDIAFLDEDPFRESARGLCGTVLLYKVLGYYAQKGVELESLYQTGLRLAERLYTLNIALGPCSLPGNPSGFSVDFDKFELGLGIHGEQGKSTVPMSNCKDIVALAISKFGAVLLKPRQLVVVLNNLGGTTHLEMSILTNEIITQLQPKHTIKGWAAGTYMTSLEMHGVSITLLVDPAKQEIGALSQHTLCPFAISQLSSQAHALPSNHHHSVIQKEKRTLPKSELRDKIQNTIRQINGKTQYLDELDREVGDGDTGTSLKRALLYILDRNILDTLNFDEEFSTSVNEIGRLVACKAAGSLGAILGSFISAASSKLPKKYTETTNKMWHEALCQGTHKIMEIGKAKLGDRTILDVLTPICQLLANQKEPLPATLLHVIQTATQQVRKLRAKKGRARYLNGKQIGKPDPGCELILIFYSSWNQKTGEQI